MTCGWKVHPRERKTALPSLRWTSALIIAILFAVAIYFAQYQTLYDAVRSDNVDLARRRLQFNWAGLGPDNGHVFHISSGDRYFQPLLPIAIQNDNAEMVDLLLDHGAEINIEELRTVVEACFNPLSDAMRRRNTEMVDHLLERGVVPTEAIRRAARDNDITMVERMLSAGADPTPAVHSAIEGEHREILELLLNSGADPSPGIELALKNEEPESLGKLLKYGADHGLLRKALRDHEPRGELFLHPFDRILDK